MEPFDKFLGPLLTWLKTNFDLWESFKKNPAKSFVIFFILLVNWNIITSQKTIEEIKYLIVQSLIFIGFIFSFSQMIKKFYFDRKNLKNLESKQKDLLIEFYESGKDFIKFKREPYVRQLEQKNYLIRDSKNFYRLNGNIMRLLKDNPSLLDPSDKEQIYEKLTADEKNLAMSFIKDLQHMNRLVEEVTAAKIRIREKEKNEDIFWKDKLLNKLRDYKIVFNNKYFYEDSTTDYPLRQWFKTLIEKEYEGKDFGEFIVI